MVIVIGATGFIGMYTASWKKVMRCWQLEEMQS